jgi:hypothetical protein
MGPNSGEAALRRFGKSVKLKALKPTRDEAASQTNLP